MATSKKAPVEMPAVAIMTEAHPAHRAFTKWLNGKAPTKRKARAFKVAYPMLFPAGVAISTT
jgi:hypothetical protein